MSQWKSILSLMCLAVWLPATQHCKLENLPGLAFLQCPTDTPDSSNCQGDSCDTVERGAYRVPDNVDLVIVPLLPAVVPELRPVVAPEPALVLSPSLLVVLSEPSSERWQYYSVRAAPVRGPSLPS